MGFKLSCPGNFLETPHPESSKLPSWPGEDLRTGKTWGSLRILDAKRALEHAIEMGRGEVYLKLTPSCTPGSCIAKAERLGAPFV